MKNKSPHSQLLGKLRQLGYTVNYGIQWKGSIFTFAYANAFREVEVKEGEPTVKKFLESEGASRRSNEDLQDDVMGKDIAEGRAIKALWLKACGIKDVHRHHILMG